MKFIASILCFFSFIACKPSVQLSKTAYILGPQNDIERIEPGRSSTISENVMNASALIVTELNNGSLKFCSGSLIHPENSQSFPRVLSNHHCFAMADANGNLSQTFFPEACAKTTVYFGHRIGSTSNLALGCKAGTLRGDPIGDLSVFELQGPVSSSVATPLTIAKQMVTTPDHEALIVHYPNEASHLQRIGQQRYALPVAAVTTNDCSITGTFPKSLWSLDASTPFAYRHTCDLIDGSSGSALLDRKTFEILGVNWGGIKYKIDGDLTVTNVATRADYVTAFLAKDLESFKETILVQRISRQGPTTGARSSSYSDSKKGACGSIGTLAHTTTAFWTLLLTLICPLAFATSPKQQSASSALEHATYTALTNAVISSEYAEVLNGGHANPQAKNGYFANRQHDVPFLIPFAVYQDAADRDQKLPHHQKFSNLVLKHHKQVKKQGKLPKSWQKDPIEAWKMSRPQKNADADFFTAIRSIKGAPCDLPKATVDTYLDHQRAYLSGLSITNNHEFLRHFDNWSLEKTRCLTWKLWRNHQMGVTGSDPLPLLMALSQMNAKLADDIVLSGIMALRFLENQSYPEALRVLFDLQKKNPALRPYYLRTQRAFSYYQKGAGDVALQGL
jgi:hypothetical protein